MSTITFVTTEPSEAQELTGLLSQEPEKQRIELSFVQRFLKTSEAVSRKALESAARVTPEQTFASEYARMQHPIFAKVSSALERSIPDTPGFGRFKGRD